MAALLVLGGCSSTPVHEVEVATLDVPLPESRPPIPDPEPIQVLPLKWVVITPDRLPEGRYVFFALTPREYENLSANMAEFLRWIKEARWRLDYYNEGP